MSRPAEFRKIKARLSSNAVLSGNTSTTLGMTKGPRSVRGHSLQHPSIWCWRWQQHVWLHAKVRNKSTSYCFHSVSSSRHEGRNLHQAGSRRLSKLIREDIFPHVQLVDSGGVYRVDRASWGYRVPTALERCCVCRSKGSRTQSEHDEQSSLHASRIFSSMQVSMTKLSLVMIESRETWLAN